MILFNVLFFAVFACLIKPSLISPYIGGKVLSRAWFAAALVLLTAVGPYGPASMPTQAPKAKPSAEADLPPWVITVPAGSKPASEETSMVAPAAAANNIEEAATFDQ